jgi:GT2 family glycosyltransferase
MIFWWKIENSNNTFFAHINHLLAFSDFYWNTKEKVRMIPSGNLSFRKEVFNKLWWFNEDFKIWAEDTDLSFNAKKRWYNIYYIPDIIINHDTTNNFLLFAKKQFKYWYISYKCRLKYPEYNIQFIFNKFLFPFLIPLLVLRNIIMLFTSKYFYKHFFYSVLWLPLLIVFKFIYWIWIWEHFYKKN